MAQIGENSVNKIAEGDAVFVFYSAENISQEETYMVVLDPRHGSYRPRSGLTQGWIQATAMDVSDNGIAVRFNWPYFYTERGRLADVEDETLFTFQACDVRSAADFTPAPLFFMPGASYRPKLSIITFRWGGKNAVVAPDQWGLTGSSCSNLFITSFIDTAVYPRLGRNYEVWTVFVEDQTDLVKIADTAHLIFGPQHPARRAEHVCAMYFIYPTAFEENCVPTAETGEDEGAAHVDQKSLFRMMKAMEKAGIPTQFPHPSGFYELLTSKRWTHMMALTPHLRVPPTVALPRMMIEKDISSAATSAINALQRVKCAQAKMGEGDAELVGPITRGVAKLGFSWEALDVKFWEGKKGLETALTQLTQCIEISGSLTGQPHDCESLLIQEYCEHDIELRLYVVNGKVEGKVYTKFCKIKANNEFGDFHQHFDSEPVCREWMGGDREALDDGERQCREAVDHWMDWVAAQICDTPPAIRFDFFIGRTPEKGKAVIWTLEICELGFSMLGEEDLPKKVFNAMLHHCLDKVVDGLPEAIRDTDGKAAEDKNAPPKAEPKKVQGEPPAPPPKAAAKSDNGKGKGKASVDAPELLYINVPVGNKEQKLCTGEYELQEDVTANGLPVWKRKGGPARWMYHSNRDQYWYVGDDDEKGQNFDCNEGYIRCPALSGNMMPHLLNEPWENFDASSEDWIQRHEILVAIEAEVLDVVFPPAAGQGAGKPNGKAGRGGKGKRIR